MKKPKHWLLVCIVATLGWSGWRTYTFRSAITEGKALGGLVQFSDPVEVIRKNWKAAFRKETWSDGVTLMTIPSGEAFEKNVAIVRRLNPKSLHVSAASNLHDLSALEGLSRLESVSFKDCTALTNVDAIKDLPALKSVYLRDTELLTNVDTLKGLSGLEVICLDGALRLPPESSAALKSALPNTRIYAP